ncbi:uncharacterized protein LOC134806691 [Cydia splendana]|uniref:uncharacterized protein LOC134806691 n=1 Tax=Cydia splendana TaxID=1100963 RepID=UPI00300D3DC0
MFLLGLDSADWVCVLIFSFFSYLLITRKLYEYMEHYMFQHLMKDFVRTSVFEGVLVCIPALFVELIHKEVDHILLILIQQHSKCEDVDLRAALSRGISYLKLRPFKFHIWRVIPIDSSLTISFISLVFTYILLILQVHQVV